MGFFETALELVFLAANWGIYVFCIPAAFVLAACLFGKRVAGAWICMTMAAVLGVPALSSYVSGLFSPPDAENWSVFFAIGLGILSFFWFMAGLIVMPPRTSRSATRP